MFQRSLHVPIDERIDDRGLIGPPLRASVLAWRTERSEILKSRKRNIPSCGT
jgi:hypothetical protein